MSSRPARWSLSAAEARAESSAAARASEQAAKLSVRDVDRARRLLEAARAAEDAGRLEASVAMAQEAGRLTTDDLEAAEIAYVLGRASARLGSSSEAVEILTGAADSVRAVDPERAALMLADAVDVAIHLDQPRAESLARAAWELPWPKDGLTEQLVTLRYADVHGWRGDAKRAATLWRRSARVVDRRIPRASDSPGRHSSAPAMTQRRSRCCSERSTLRDSGALSNVLTQSLEFIAQAEARRGRLQAALDAVSEELDLVSALRQQREELYACGVIAWIEAALGHEADCRAHHARAVDVGRRVGRPVRTGAAVASSSSASAMPARQRSSSSASPPSPVRSWWVTRSHPALWCLRSLRLWCVRAGLRKPSCSSRASRPLLSPVAGPSRSGWPDGCEVSSMVLPSS